VIAVEGPSVSDEAYPRPIVTVDIVLLTLYEGALSVALLPRPTEPYAGLPALIGGYVHTDEDVVAEDAVHRILRAKAGVQGIFFEQLQTFASATRDPRGWSVSIAYFALVPQDKLDSTDTTLLFRPAEDPGTLPFDHEAIVKAALDRVRGKGAYSTIPARLLPDEFTMSELQAIYQTVMGERLDQSAFRRKVGELDLLEQIEGRKRQTKDARRPTTLYRLKKPMSVFDRRL
jgi:ADP-ribose pyrophosphatase YjhB (NUDIX family)